MLKKDTMVKDTYLHAKDQQLKNSTDRYLTNRQKQTKFLLICIALNKNNFGHLLKELNGKTETLYYCGETMQLNL